MRLTLDTKNTRAIVANFYAADQRAQRAIRRVVKASGVRLHEDARSRTPVDTGFMRSQLRLRYSDGGLVYNVGWDEADFTAAGLVFYPVYVIFGSRGRPANDPLFPARDAEAPRFDADLRTALKAAIARRGR